MNIQPTLFEVTRDHSAVADKILSEMPEEFTLYQLAKAVNKAREEVGVEGTVRPQMIYNYARNGMVVRGRKSTENVTRDQAQEFLTRYLDRTNK